MRQTIYESVLTVAILWSPVALLRFGITHLFRSVYKCPHEHDGDQCVVAGSSSCDGAPRFMRATNPTPNPGMNGGYWFSGAYEPDYDAIARYDFSREGGEDANTDAGESDDPSDSEQSFTDETEIDSDTSAFSRPFASSSSHQAREFLDDAELMRTYAEVGAELSMLEHADDLFALGLDVDAEGELQSAHDNLAARFNDAPHWLQAVVLLDLARVAEWKDDDATAQSSLSSAREIIEMHKTKMPWLTGIYSQTAWNLTDAHR